jgi:hypothetical protein
MTDVFQAPRYDQRDILLDLLASASERLGVPCWYATVAHRQIYDDYAARRYPDPAEFETVRAHRLELNARFRRVVAERGPAIRPGIRAPRPARGFL